jgi:hypothetical protein
MVDNPKKSKLPSLHLADSGFLFDPYTGLTFGVNETGAAFIRALREGLTIDEAARKVAEEFDVPPATAEADAREFYDRLNREGLLWRR